MAELIKIPKRYYDDHVDCDCIAPQIIRETKQHYFIDPTENDEMAEFRSRLNLYADSYCTQDYWENGFSGVVLSARATLAALKKAKGE
tara:strand:+ start:431 stop:694 length:264 start_codon:yes stop_codon:yes gene_type:complete